MLQIWQGYSGALADQTLPLPPFSPFDLALLSRCDVSDALCKLKNGQIQHRTNGGFLAGLTMWSPERQSGDVKIIGPAYTVQYRPVDDQAPKIDHHYVREPQK